MWIMWLLEITSHIRTILCVFLFLSSHLVCFSGRARARHSVHAHAHALAAPISLSSRHRESSGSGVLCARALVSVHEPASARAPDRRVQLCRKTSGKHAHTHTGAWRAHGAELLLPSVSGLLLQQDKMSFLTLFSRRHLFLRALLVQVFASLGTFAAPSPIIKFPGDDPVSRTDKEVALVSGSWELIWKMCHRFYR